MIVKCGDNMECIDVMLADDHGLIREGIKQLLEFDRSIKVIDEASDGEECLLKVINTKAKVLLLDINMPKKNGLEVLREIKKKNLGIKVLVLTVHDEVEYLLKAVDIGADGYILKDSEIKELKTAIQVLACGEYYIQPKLIPALNSRLIDRDTDKDKIELLTERELEVLVQIANGLLNKEIATILNISERTVKNHISNIFKKIDVADRTQAAVFAIKNDIVRIY